MVFFGVIASSRGSAESGLSRRRREKGDRYARCVLVKIGNKVIRGRNGHIGIRCLGENAPHQSASHPVPGGKTKWGRAPAGGGSIVIPGEAGTTNPAHGEVQRADVVATALECRGLNEALHIHVRKGVSLDSAKTSVMAPNHAHAFLANDRNGHVRRRNSSANQIEDGEVYGGDPVDPGPETSSD